MAIQIPNLQSPDSALKKGKSADSSGQPPQPPIHGSDTIRSIGFLKLRGKNDDLPRSWWFASVAIPLLAATQGPLSNVLSIAALVTPWRLSLPNNGQLPEGADDFGVGISDPRWEITLNAISLTCGFAGNLLLLFHFVGRVRYIVALPLSIVFWLLASGILIALTACLSIYDAAEAPGQIYSQGFWHAVLASITYMLGAVMLMTNFVGYLRGHYPQNFELDDNQRTLILQTMMFMGWLAGGAGIFMRLEGWSYANALYFCDITILTIGFGDITPTSNAARGFLFIYEFIGIIFLGLVISSITRFASNISADKIVKNHQKRVREHTIDRTVTNEIELRERLGLPRRRKSSTTTDNLAEYGNIKIQGRTVTFKEHRPTIKGSGRGGAGNMIPLSRDAKMKARSQGESQTRRLHERRQKLLLLTEEKDRFNAMREIQEETRRFKQYWSLSISIFAFALMWLLGALVFMLSEARLQGLTYFDSLYFCFVTLLTIGYGDFSPKSNIGKPFFIVWSLIAVPSLTILIQNLSSTVFASVNRGTFTLAEWTILPKKGVLKAFLDGHPRLRDWLIQAAERKEAEERVEEGFQIQDPDETEVALGDEVDGEVDNDVASSSSTEATGKPNPGAEKLRVPGSNDAALNQRGKKEEVTIQTELETTHDLARQLSVAIKHVAQDLRADPPKRYNYEEWVHFTKLIRFSSARGSQNGPLAAVIAVARREEEEGLVEWDWIGEESPMLADVSESEWVLGRLCESLDRYMRVVGAGVRADERRQIQEEEALVNMSVEGANDEPHEGDENRAGPSL